MRYSFISYLVLLIILMAGCATSNSGQKNGPSEENTSGFDTGLSAADIKFENNSLLDPVRMKFRVSAQCTGADCIPDEAQLAFFVTPGPTKVILYDLSLTINTDEEKYKWPGPDLRFEGGTLAAGLVKSVPLDEKMLHQIAENKDISGYLAGQRFEWSYENREPIRKLLADMQLPDEEH